MNLTTPATVSMAAASPSSFRYCPDAKNYERQLLIHTERIVEIAEVPLDNPPPDAGRRQWVVLNPRKFPDRSHREVIGGLLICLL